MNLDTLPFRLLLEKQVLSFNPVALRKAKLVYNFGLSECCRVKRREEKDFGTQQKVGRHDRLKND